MAEIDDIDSFNTTQGEECVGVRIYALKDPRDGQIRYIGKTIFNLKKRLTEHLHEAFDIRSTSFKSEKCKWIRELFEKDKLPYAEQIDFATENWAERETHWIKYYRDNGANLTNICDGGQGRFALKRVANIDFNSLDTIDGLLKKTARYAGGRTKAKQIIALSQITINDSDKIENKYVAIQIFCYLYAKEFEGSTSRELMKSANIKTNKNDDINECLENMIDCEIITFKRYPTKGRPRIVYYIKDFVPTEEMISLSEIVK